MADYTSTQAGEWNDVDTWGGGGFPASSADTATIGHTVTMPTGVSITCGAITLNAATLQINGTLTLSAASTFADGYTLSVGAGGTIDLAGQTIAYSGAATCYNTFTGTAGNRATVIGGGGTWGQSTSKPQVLTAQYCDFSGMAAAWIGRSHTSALTMTMQHCTVTDCGGFYVDSTGTNAGASFLVEYCDFSDWRVATDPMLSIFQQATSTAQRTVRYCTFDNSMNVSAGKIQLTTVNTTHEHNVYQDVVIDSKKVGSSDVYRYNFFSNTLSESPFFVAAGTYFREFYGNYVYYEQGNHTFTPSGNQDFDFIGNVFDNKDGTAGVNWFLNGATSATDSMLIANNLFLGKGNAVVRTLASNLGTITFRNNTSMVDNDGGGDSGQFFPIWFMTEQAATDVSAMTVEIYSNLYFDPDDSDAIQDPVIDLVSGGITDELDYIDYNMGWSAPTGSQDILYDDSVVMTGGVAPNDFTSDPSLLDRSRDLKTFDALHGGAGTVSNLITELLKRNKSDFDSNYTPSNLVRYTLAGFQPQSTGVYGGRYSETCGCASLYTDIATVSAIESLQDTLISEIAAI